MSRMRGFSCMLLMAAAVLSTACLARQQYAQENNDHKDEEVRAVANANNEFAMGLYARLTKEEGNVFFSPYSISTALAMTMAGARGETEKEMAATLKFDMERDKLHAAVGRMIEDLNKTGEEGAFALAVANALWGQRGYDFRQEFIEFVEQKYGAGFNEVDFAQATEQARQTINKWVEEKTNDLIKDLIPEGALDRLTRLVLTNAIYFKGDWVNAFDPDETEQAPFKVVQNGEIREVEVPMMRQKEEFAYAETDNAQLLLLPYEGERLSMVVVLPRETGGLAELEKGLTIDKLGEYLAAPRGRREVIVHLPRFKMEWEKGVGEILKDMGMKKAFAPNEADFIGMSPNRELFISEVFHKAYVDVNEEGTEAAAATGVVMRITAVMPKPPVFRADHPFLFFIVDNETDAILFMGRVADPS